MQAPRSSDHEPAVRTVGVQELKAEADSLVREVSETGRPIDIMQNGQITARLSPASTPESEPRIRSWTDEERAVFWKRMDDLTREISRVWPKGVSAVDAVREQRRDL